MPRERRPSSHGEPSRRDASRRSRPAPTRADHDRFCVVEGWRVVRDARGDSIGHHVTYELDLPDGRTLRTRVSHPPNRETYGPALWRHVLGDQLCVDEATFWACVRDRTRPSRGAVEPTPDGIPAEMVHLLVHRVGLSESEVGRMTRHQAVERLAAFWSEPPSTG